jgi:hypothetical protein
MAALLLLLTFILAYFSQIVHGVNIPGPDSAHKYKSAVAHFALVDSARQDPYASGESRKVMVSLFMPVPVSACKKECEVPYVSVPVAKVANNQTLGNPNAGVFEKMQYTVCCSSSNVLLDTSKIPVVVLEPNTDTSRLLYANLARYMTANNVAVVLIDHPHDSSVVQFPDSSLVYQAGATGLSNYSPLTSWNETVFNALNIRIQDIDMVLAQLRNPSVLANNFPNVHFANGLDTRNFSVVGHGFGGTVATALSAIDPRVIFSINLSGSAPPLNKDTAAPVYFIGRSDYRREDDINWPAAWKHLTGPATEFDLGDSGIMDFTDLPIVIDTAGTKGLHGFGLGNSGPWVSL